MRLACLVLAMFLFLGCAMRPSARPAAPVVTQDGLTDQDVERLAEPAAALVFDPLPELDHPGIDFPRDPRSQGAFWGIQGPVTTFFYQRTDDRYGSGWDFGTFGDRYRRRTVETRVGTSVR